MVGSPPRMRGKLFAGVNGVSASGITPADAGKTCNRENLIKQREDHPRGCGENKNEKGGTYERKGSPPRMRGKRADSWRKKLEYGITPADAGKTFYGVFRPPND